jgi:hypothetical protein
MEDFSDACVRHWIDAEMLLNDPAPQIGHTRLANASHLYGICAECAFKTILYKWDPARKRGGHMPSVWNELAVHPNAVAMTKIIGGSNPFAGTWNIGDRYLNRTDVKFEINQVQAHRSAAKQARAILEHAQLTGII